MSAEDIISIAKGDTNINEKFEEVGKLEKHKEDAETLRKNILQTLEDYKESGVEKWELSMSCGLMLFSLMIPLHLETYGVKDKGVKSQEEKEKISNIYDKISVVSNTVEKFYRENIDKDWKQVFSGFAAEIACAVTLKRGGFDVYIPDKTDDTEGKIDLLAFDRDNMLFPIQVKSSSLLKDVVTEDLTQKSINYVEEQIVSKWDNKFNSGDSNIVASSRVKLQDMLNSTHGSCQQLLTYLSPVINKKNAINVIPILTAIPGGENEDSLYNYRNGSLTKMSENILAEKICDKLIEISYYHEGVEYV